MKEANFVVDGKPWYPVGINYWPLYVSGLDTEAYSLGWFDPACYDPEEIERDLQRMKALGINMVSGPLGDLEDQPNLLDFLRRCRHHGVRVNGFLNRASPIGFNEPGGASSRPASSPEPHNLRVRHHLGAGQLDVQRQGRVRWDRDWEAWIVERYGTSPRPRPTGACPSPAVTEGRLAATTRNSATTAPGASWSRPTAASWTT